MTRPRRLTRVAAAAAVVSSMALVPSAAVSPAGAIGRDSPSLKGLELKGGCEDETGQGLPDLKVIHVTPQTRFWFAPMRILGRDFEKTHKWLFPYTLTVVDGPSEGLKTRHMTPGMPYFRPGKAPSHPIMCSFTGTSVLAGNQKSDFELLITGSVLGR
ncbi:MAG: hypothetical protein R2720_00800 [Candidatus Nanopelagicales bacterium]